MYRELTSHKVNGCNEAISVSVLDEPVAAVPATNIALPPRRRTADSVRDSLPNGLIAEAGVNGLYA